jgi:alpha-tubulin suppressor-like RCC1 family protein
MKAVVCLCSGTAWKWNEHLLVQEGLLRRSIQMELIDKETKFLRRLLLSADQESGYTALHEAVYAKDLPKILLLLRYASDAEATRLTRRPMELLYGSGASTLVREMACAKDHEGMTPAALLASHQLQPLAECRKYLDATKSRHFGKFERVVYGFECSAGDDRNEFDPLSRALDDGQANEEDSVESREQTRRDSNNNKVTHGCEVFTFGRAHHCALGVVMSDKNHQDKNEKLRPQRVQAFAHDTVGKLGSAVTAAAAAYHTLVVTARGELFAFGLGKGFRLGTGSEKPCATPVRVQGPLLREKVIGVAAAENHSLCVTSSGQVYAFGSNGFGQLGLGTENTATGLPRKVDDLKHVFCIAVAAGTKHSVFLSQNGEVFVCGDNSDGQLSFSKRSGNNCYHRVQRVDALWKADSGPRKAFAIAASEHSTMALISGSGGRGLPLNSVYCWGHGNHCPSRIKFDSVNSSRPINPVAIACARYHYVALSSDGCVYSWGLRADSLGTVSGQSRSRSGSTGKNEVSSRPALTDPQLVAGMLKENGGGFAVAVSASENHTAIVTATGALYTFGDTYKANVMGHEGVRWQPEPKRVPGVHQAVGVAASKEHIVLLIATAFPELPMMQARIIPTLEEKVGMTIAEHVDLFNVIPILVIAERTRTPHLLCYCKKFIKMNLDGVLNVGQRSAMDCFLNEQLLDSSKFLHDREEAKDAVCHPFIRDVLFAGSVQQIQGKQGFFDDVESWLQACELILSRPAMAALVGRISAVSAISVRKFNAGEYFRLRSSSISEESASYQPPELHRQQGLCSSRCEELTKNMNFSSATLAQARHERLSKEVRSIRKLLNQITKLEQDRACGSIRLTEEQNIKLARKAQLEADLLVFEPAMEIVEEKIRTLRLNATKELNCKSQKDEFQGGKDTIHSSVVCTEHESGTTFHVEGKPTCCTLSFRCDTCEITCPDERSYELHLRGRKHRNHLLNRADEEERIAAASILADQHRKIVLSAEHSHNFKNESKAASSLSATSPWGKKADTKVSSFYQQFKLPPPPHEVAEFVVRAADTCQGAQALSAGCEQQKTKSSEHELLPTNVTCATKTFREIMAEEEETRKCQSTNQKQYRRAKPVKTAPLMKVSPGVLSPTTIVPHKPSMSASQSGIESMQHSRPCAWSSSPNVVTRSTTAVTLRDIQEQEISLKVKQDRSICTSGRWFVQQRDRAGSFKDIQHETERLLEEQRFIEEQINIEKQIYEEIAARKATENRTPHGRKTKINKKVKQSTARNKSVETGGKTSMNIQITAQNKKSPTSMN